jgi:hypothetical protein
MKNLMLMAVLVTVIAACQSKSARVQQFINGVYVNRNRGELSVADDTLTFTHIDANHYLISRSTGYQAIRAGKLLPKRLKREKLEGTYDPANRVLNETTTGRVFRFDPDKGELLLKQAVYQKIN